jgi:uncharacterized protein (DUF2236 family)
MAARSDEAGVFPPDSLIRRVSRENAVLLGGPAAAILQVAHPMIGAGVAAHSRFRADTLGRLHRTLEAVYTVAFGTAAEAERLREHVAAVHRPVRGDQPVTYDASNPDAQLWVLATLIAVGTEVYETLVEPLTPVEREAHYRDMRVFGEYFGLSRDFGPASLAEFDEYYAKELASEKMGSLPVSSEVAREIVAPGSPWWFAVGTRPARQLVIETIPPPVRERLGFRSTAVGRVALRGTVGSLRRLIPSLPGRVRFCGAHLRTAIG